MLAALSIAMLTAITVWWLLIQRLKDKPWLKQGVIPTSQEGVTSSAPKVGLWVFLAVVSSLFGLFASAYSMRMVGHGGAVVVAALDRFRRQLHRRLRQAAGGSTTIASGESPAIDASSRSPGTTGPTPDGVPV